MSTIPARNYYPPDRRLAPVPPRPRRLQYVECMREGCDVLVHPSVKACRRCRRLHGAAEALEGVERWG